MYIQHICTSSVNSEFRWLSSDMSYYRPFNSRFTPLYDNHQDLRITNIKLHKDYWGMIGPEIDKKIILTPGIVPNTDKKIIPTSGIVPNTDKKITIVQNDSIPDFKYVEYFVTHLKLSGFPGLDIVRYLRKNSETTIVAGPFVVQMVVEIADTGNLNMPNHNSINIITTDTNTLAEIAGIIADQFQQSDLVTGFSCSKRCGVSQYDHKTVVTTFSPNLTDQGKQTNTHLTKINVVVLDGGSARDYINSNFTVSISKSYFDGFNVKYIGCIKKHFTEMLCHLRPWYDDIVALEETLNLVEYYKKLGFNVKFPERVKLNAPIKLTDEFITSMLHQHYSKTKVHAPIKLMYEGQDSYPLVGKYFNIATTHTLTCSAVVTV